MFSYEDYREIIRRIKETGLQADYAEALERDAFIIMRHDVEYSVERARELAKVEESMDFRSTYFFQWTNNSYNILSRKNRDILTDMHERGQHIGLHFALNGMTDMELVRKRIRKEIDMLSDMLGFEIRAFSIHRPSPDVLAENIKLPGILNAYQDDFFSFAPNVTDDTSLAVKYMSDANHIWRYGYPDEANIRGHRRVQILTHPFAWTKKGYDNLNNYRTLIDEKYMEMIDSIDNECKDFAELREHFETVPSLLRKQ
ncbi:hypothetical protein [Lachnoclostridium sp. Marseille-P6806]|uniref:hypothetical protein n=1 Tax=Lachnoclostridium sp. Marseille-P6806 TaxID=2364793 RepID=UPI00102FCD9A|nr:hypothetical protein [Lachnoclostridium sp. Marseille-P6806]